MLSAILQTENPISLKYYHIVIPVYIDASLAATGIFDVFATKQVLCIILYYLLSIYIFNYGKSLRT